MFAIHSARKYLGSFQGRTLFIFLIFCTLALSATWYVVRYMTRTALFDEKGEKLTGYAAILNTLLGPESYEDILVRLDAQEVSREEKIILLNHELAGITDQVASAYPGLGIGFYSKELDAILTYGPSATLGSNVGRSIAPDHAGRRVMARNQAEVSIGTMVRGNIMNAMLPVERHGRVIGYIWANELTTSIEAQLKAAVQRIYWFTGVSYFLAAILVFMLSRKMDRDITAVIKGIRLLRFDLSRRIERPGGELGEIVDSVNNMAEEIAKANEERKALLVAEATNIAQRDFLARMSHEIRTPMNGVLGMTRLAMQAQNPQEQMGYLRKIQTSATLLLGILNDILDFSKIEAGKLTTESRPFNLQEMLDSVRDLIAPRAAEKNLKFVTSTDGALPENVVGDGLRISQVLLNLLGNAVKFTPEGEIRMLVTASRPAERGLIRLDFAVSDTGIGLSHEQQERLFKPFSQADASTARKFGGTGLGLSISKALVELMNGQIGVASEEGKGSTFSFHLDVMPFDGVIQDDAAMSAEVSNQRYDGLSFLLVEDNVINQEVAVAILEELGATVEVAENGEEGVNAFLRKDYDLILMDIRMPVMSGFEATQAIRSSSKHDARRIPIIAMTADAMQEDRQATQSAGMNGHISKPIDIVELKSVLYHELFDPARKQNASADDVAPGGDA